MSHPNTPLQEEASQVIFYYHLHAVAAPICFPNLPLPLASTTPYLPFCHPPCDLQTPAEIWRCDARFPHHSLSATTMPSSPSSSCVPSTPSGRLSPSVPHEGTLMVPISAQFPLLQRPRQEPRRSSPLPATSSPPCPSSSTRPGEGPCRPHPLPRPGVCPPSRSCLWAQVCQQDHL